MAAQSVAEVGAAAGDGVGEALGCEVGAAAAGGDEFIVGVAVGDGDPGAAAEGALAGAATSSAISLISTSLQTRAVRKKRAAFAAVSLLKSGIHRSSNPNS